MSPQGHFALEAHNCCGHWVLWGRVASISDPQSSFKLRGCSLVYGQWLGLGELSWPVSHVMSFPLEALPPPTTTPRDSTNDGQGAAERG